MFFYPLSSSPFLYWMICIFLLICRNSSGIDSNHLLFELQISPFSLWLGLLVVSVLTFFAQIFHFNVDTFISLFLYGFASSIIFKNLLSYTGVIVIISLLIIYCRIIHYYQTYVRKQTVNIVSLCFRKYCGCALLVLLSHEVASGVSVSQGFSHLKF